MEQYNRIELKGTVGFVKIQSFGKSKVARISLATNYVYKNKEGEPVIETTWHNVNAWENKEIRELDRIEKGSRLHVCGRLRNQRYADNDGVEHSTYEVLADKLLVLDEQLSMQSEF